LIFRELSANAVFILMPSRADSLLLGVFAAIAVRSARVWKCLLARSSVLYAVTGILFSGMVFMTYAKWETDSTGIVYVGFSWIACSYVCLLLIGVSQPQGIIARLLRFRLLREIGSVAYGLYMVHIPVLYLCHWVILHDVPRRATLKTGVVTLVALAVSIAIAKLSWAYFEGPLVKIGHRRTYG